jgi:NTE family protein
MNPRLALVLAGGGARGAYEAGVLRFILKDLPARIGHPVAADLICGTSVGAINGAAIAAWNGDPQGPTELSEFWNELSVSDVYRFEALDLLRSPVRMMRGPASDEMAWLDARPLHALMASRFPWEQLYEVIDGGRLQALVLTSTEVITGRCAQFIDGQIEANSMEEHRGIRRVFERIGHRHVLASCAIPFLFPPVEINGTPMVDGSLRQNTPLSPALRMGAENALVVGTRVPKPIPPLADMVDAPKPSTGFLLGKALNALLLDPVHQDLDRIDLINEMLAAGSDVYGPDFVDRLNGALGNRISRRLRPINTLCIHPSEDLGRIAAQIWDPKKIETTRGTRFLLSTVAGESEEADLLSYLLFDASFTAVIEDLGHQDASARETEIIRFLEQCIMATDS